jgi:hypothetical protein
MWVWDVGDEVGTEGWSYRTGMLRRFETLICARLMGMSWTSGMTR